VRHDFLRTQRAKLPPFTLSPETIKREGERKNSFPGNLQHHPGDAESGEHPAYDPQGLGSEYVLGSCDMR